MAMPATKREEAKMEFVCPQHVSPWGLGMEMGQQRRFFSFFRSEKKGGDGCKIRWPLA